MQFVKKIQVDSDHFINRLWPFEPVFFQALLPQAKSVTIPVQSFYNAPLPIAENKQISRKRIVPHALSGASAVSAYFLFSLLSEEPKGTFGSIDLLILILVLVPHYVIIRFLVGIAGGASLGWAIHQLLALKRG